MDVVDLRSFYAHQLGVVARRFIGRGIRGRWNDVRAQRVLGIGYPTPYLGLFREEAERCLAFMPGTQGDPGYGVEPARNASPNENVRVGQDYMQAMLNKFGGDLRTAAYAYNWGPGNVERWLSEGADPAKLPRETRDYAERLLGSGISVTGER